MKPFGEQLTQAIKQTHVEDHGIGSVRGYLQMACDTAGPNGARLIFIGNGGSAAIASHMAADWMKNAGFSTLCFNDPASLTCISNDLGYASVFRLPLEKHGRVGDVLFAISSSGNSMSIVTAVQWAVENHLNVVTLSGFSPDNLLRKAGGVNFYVPSFNYGIVEITHLTILHALLDEVINDAAKRPPTPARRSELRLGDPVGSTGVGDATIRAGSESPLAREVGRGFQG